jgi:hypothetical protein
MSRLGKKPAEKIAAKVKNVNLLPAVFNTEPNQKMLDSTLDVMTSKGQLLPFEETYGLRTATNKVDEFFKVESDQVRRESQGNAALVLENQNGEYLDKVSYLDIENYFTIKGASLVDGVLLDKNINVLNLPISPSMITDFNLYYWLSDNLPACRIHLNSAKFSIDDDLVGRQYVTVKDDLTLKELRLQTGMALYFTGAVDDFYKTTDLSNPKIFLVYNVGESIQLIEESLLEKRIPVGYLRNVPYDDNFTNDLYDGSNSFTDIEYIVQENFTVNGNNWQVANHWYHISVIRAVAKFHDIKVEDIAKFELKARRPIICFDRAVKLFNWPAQVTSEIKTILPTNKNKYQNKQSVTDPYGYTLQDGDKLVFEEEPGIYQCTETALGLQFNYVGHSAEDDGALIVANSTKKYYQVVFKNGKWKFAQNKTEKNQAPRFEFRLSDGRELSVFSEINYEGGIILGFKDGETFDPVLQRYVDATGILINAASISGEISPHQLKFSLDIDTEFFYPDSVTGERIYVKGPYGYKYNEKIIPFYQPRLGLDFTRQIQDVLISKPDDETWSANINPVVSGFNKIHIFYDDNNQYKIYFELEKYGLVKFSSKRFSNFKYQNGAYDNENWDDASWNHDEDSLEQLLPLISGSTVQIICHQLPEPITFYKAEVVDNITRPVAIASNLISNNGTSNGIIELDLSASVLSGGSYVDNQLSETDTFLWFTLGGQYKTAVVKSIENWYFIQNVFLMDYKKPLYETYDYTISDFSEDDGTVSYFKKITETNNLFKKTKAGDKLGISSIIADPTSRTAPLALTSNPLNETFDDLSYYSLFEHNTNIKANSANHRKYLDPEALLLNAQLGGGTIIKHDDSMAKAAITAVNLPYDFTEIIIKQGKHYDMFLTRLKTELTNVINNNNYSQYTSLEILNLALKNIYNVIASETMFWSHSNMIGWGEVGTDYAEKFVTIDSTLVVNLQDAELSNISHRTGKETLLHITYDNKLLTRGVDYWLMSVDDNEYSYVKFAASYQGDTVSIKQWPGDFQSLVPASLAKIGLSAVYRPEIYLDGSFYSNSYFLVRHDGTRYYLQNGVDSNQYPVDLIDQYLYEYEKAVWSSIAKDVEQNNQRELLENQPGYFRQRAKSWNSIREIVSNESRRWLVENNIFSMNNTVADPSNGFTLKYQLGTGDGDFILGSWRAIYKYLYDTDRLHSHPWEMLGYSVKPDWWDVFYSWTVDWKRTLLETALRTGNVANPSLGNTKVYLTLRKDIAIGAIVDGTGNTLEVTETYLPDFDYRGGVIRIDDELFTYTGIDSSLGYSKFLGVQRAIYNTTAAEHRANVTVRQVGFVESNPAFARIININSPESFPVTSAGELMSPLDLPWLDIEVLDADTDWSVGDIGPIEYVFLNTHRGLAAEVQGLFLISPAQYVNLNWVPGQVIYNSWNNKIDRTTGYWQSGTLAHDYHRKVVNDQTVYTGGIESLFAEFCLLNNKDYISEVIDKFYNPQVKKEFLLNGFTNKDSVRIQSNSLNNNHSTLFVPEKNYEVRTVKHYTDREIFYSGVRIIFDGSGYSINGYSSEAGKFAYFEPKENSPTVIRTIGDVNFKEKTSYNNEVKYLRYGTAISNRQEIYDFLIGYGKYLESIGFVYEEAEAGDIKNWQLVAKQFIFWSNNKLASGSFIDLNPSADAIIIQGFLGQLDNLEGTNENVGQIVNRLGQPLFSKDLLVKREPNLLTVKTKDKSNSIYGVKLSFSVYETVVHLDPVSEFQDIYFDPARCVNKLSFIVGGKKSQAWDGTYFAPGYVFNEQSLMPNLESMSDLGRNLLDIENVILDPTIVDASRNQFGLNRNPELRELFLQEDNETSFKNAVTFNKGSKRVFDSLQPLTHPDGSSTIPYEEYMVRIGEFGNTENIEFYEFELNSSDIQADSRLIKFSDSVDVDAGILQIKSNSNRWVHRPYNKNLTFDYLDRSYTNLKTAGPIITGDTDYSVTHLTELENLYEELGDIWNIDPFFAQVSYKVNDLARYDGRLYFANQDLRAEQWIALDNVSIIGTNGQFSCDTTIIKVGQFVYISGALTGTGLGSIVGYTGVTKKYWIISTNGYNQFVLSASPGGAALTTTAGKTTGLKFNDVQTVIDDHFTEIDEPWLPNIYVQNYYRSNPNLTGADRSVFNPGTWQVLQLVDRNLGVLEACPGITDISKARVTVNQNHNLEIGDYVVIVNANTEGSSVNGIWAVEDIDAEDPTRFFVNTRIVENIKTGKVFLLKPIRFKNNAELTAATGVSAESNNYVWKKKYNPFTNIIGSTALTLLDSPSGYNRTYPIAIVDDGLTDNPAAATYDYGNYKVYSVIDGVVSSSPVKQESLPVDPSNIEHLVVYDYADNKIVAKLELFDPKKLLIPEVLKKDIDVISRVDPAKYNRTTDAFKSIYTSLGWYEEFVGRRWWDTSTTVFNDYESVNEDTRAKYWGTTVDNQLPEIYEWTKSTVHPSQWQSLVDTKQIVFGQLATGEVYVDKTLNTDNYHWVEETDYVNGKAYTTYYFWVKNKKTISQEIQGQRVYTVEQLSKSVLNPSNLGIAWWAPLTSDSIVVKGIESYLRSSDTVVQIKKKIKGEEKHQQWLFVSENNTVKTIPEWVHRRFRDSISGHIFYQVIDTFDSWEPADTYNQSDIVMYGTGSVRYFICKINGLVGVPPLRADGTIDTIRWQPLTDVFEYLPDDRGTWDGYFWDRIDWAWNENNKFYYYREKYIPDQLNLHRFNRLGNDIRPFPKNWFDDLVEARRVFIKKLNEILLSINVTALPTWNNSRLKDTDYTVGDETYDLTKFWEYVDYRSQDFDSGKTIDTTINGLSGLYTLSISANAYVKIINGLADFSIYRKNEDSSYDIVYKKNGTIQFVDDLYAESSVSQWDGIAWDQTGTGWDNDINSIYNAIVDSIREEIFVGNNMNYYSIIICSMFRYILSEQVNVDWLTKASTIEPVNLISKPIDSNNYLKRDEVTVLLNFFNSVKAYRDKIRNATINKEISEQINVEINEEILVRDTPTFSTIGSTTDIPVDITGGVYVTVSATGSTVDIPIEITGGP